MMMIPGQPLKQLGAHLYKAVPLGADQVLAYDAALANVLAPRYTAWGVGNSLFATPKAAATPWVAAGVPPEALQLLRFEAPQEVLSLNALQAGLLAGEGDRVLGPVAGVDPPPTVGSLLEGYADWVAYEHTKAAALAAQQGVGATAFPVVPETVADAYAAQHQLAQGEAVPPEVVASLMRAFEDRHGAYSTNHFLQSLGYSGKQVGSVPGGLPLERTILFGARLPNALGHIDVPNKAFRSDALTTAEARAANPPAPNHVPSRPPSAGGQPVSALRSRHVGGNTQVFGAEAS